MEPTQEQKWEAEEYIRSKVEAGLRVEEKPNGIVVITDPRSVSPDDRGPYL